MLTSDVLKLIGAGFTKEEILAMEQAEMPVEENASLPKEEVQEEPVQEEPSTVNSIKEELDRSMKLLSEEIQDFRRRVQDANVLTAQMKDEQLKRDTPEDIIARIINPQTKKGV